MKFAMFYLVEYAEAVAMSVIISTLFLGGWRGPWLPPWLWVIVKTGAVFFLMVWVRTTMPRARIDQMMAFAWKFLLPLALINLLVTGVEILFLPVTIPWTMVVINIVIALALIPLWSKIFRSGWSKVEV
jgi:NADH-quinone oxidoreductase subunit H